MRDGRPGRGLHVPDRLAPSWTTSRTSCAGAHLEDGVPWREMAVLVRAGARTIPSMRRALTAAGVPLEIDGDDLPLRHEPAVAPF